MKLKTIKKYVPLVFTFGVRIFIAYITWVKRYFKHKDKYSFEQRKDKLVNLLTKSQKSLKLDIRVDGLENMPNETFYLVANHLSGFDGIIPLIVLKDYNFKIVAKEEIRKYPIVGKALGCIDTIFLPREDLKQSLRIMMQIQKELENKSFSYLIFAEGTRNRDPLCNLLPMHHGTFRPAMKANVPIVPMAMTGTQRMLHFTQKYKRYPIHLKIMKPIYPSEYQSMSTEEVALLVQEKINNAIAYDLNIKDIKEMSKIDKKYNHSLCGRTI